MSFKICIGVGFLTVLINGLPEKLIDLTHKMKEGMVYYRGVQKGFTYQTMSAGPYFDVTWIAAGQFSTGEHVGTHIDAPYHFSRTGWKLDEIPMDRLVDLPAVIIDIEAKAAINSSYAVSVSDVENWEDEHGPVPARSVVFMCSGWDKYFDNESLFVGGEPSDPSSYRFPGFGVDAARYLIDKRNIYGLAVDTLSLDIGINTTFPVHDYAASKNVFGLENVKGACFLPPSGTRVNVFPIKISGGSGGPTRIIVSYDKATVIESVAAKIVVLVVVVILSAITLLSFYSNKFRRVTKVL